ncbi:TMEM175 family protein [Glutamicibacter sp.]|uniref:TMEM175 family protein n=1 Tax=Glutamicibacter sp. TaxID=1931995 RepID=UPI002B493B49|nr:TMEM175 family protein [Glutamicibacter sp.]HJX78308.1 TMEM175 family protein [Glutamicibacter sp.]
MKANEHGEPSDTGRLEAFSDGVIAVAITLLILDIKVPEPEVGKNLADELVALWPNMLAYLISFVAIGIMWLNHHTMFNRLARVDHSIMVLNLFLLLCIVTLPFSTSLLSTYLNDPGDGTLAAIVYACSFLATSFLFITLQHHVLSRRAHLLREPVTESEKKLILRRGTIALPAYVIAAAAALISPYLTLAICVVLGLFYLISTAGRGREPDGKNASTIS